MEKFSLNINPTTQLTANSSAEHQAEPKTSTTRRDDHKNNKQPITKSNTSPGSSGHFLKTSMTRCNSCTITGSLQQRVTYTCEIQNTTEKTSTTNHNDRHPEPINTNIMNMNENNRQEKGAKITR